MDITVNPFTVDPVIRILLEEADITTLKTLRELTSNWNQLDLHELEKRASKGELEEINFSIHEDKIFMLESNLEEAQAKLLLFLEATREIPGLFRDFRFHFPESFKFIQSSFFTQYPPMFIHLDFDFKFRFNDESAKLLHNFLIWVGPTLKHIYIKMPKLIPMVKLLMDLPKVPEIPKNQLFFPKLIKFHLSNGSERLMKELKVIFFQDGVVERTPSLIDLGFDEFDLPLDHLLGIDLRSRNGHSRWARLTHLQIGARRNVEITTQVLLKLSEFGMALKHLDLKLVSGDCNLLGISRNLSHFLEFQKKSLQTLALGIAITVTMDPESIPEEFQVYKIQFPIFEQLSSLKTLDLKIFKNNTTNRIQRIFEIDSIPVHFPKLINLELTWLKDFKKSLFESQANPQPFPIKRIHVLDWMLNQAYSKEFMDWFRDNFEFVVQFDCYGTLLEGGQELPWGETLEDLQITIVTEHLKLAHLTQLKNLCIFEWNALIYESEGYLEYFKDVFKLKDLKQITFKFYKWDQNKISDKVKGRFARFFPFPVVFKLKYNN